MRILYPWAQNPTIQENGESVALFVHDFFLDSAQIQAVADQNKPKKVAPLLLNNVLGEEL